MTTRIRLTLSLILLNLAFLAGLIHGQKSQYDFILPGARIVDGTGAPWFVADIGIVGERITAIGDLSQASPAETSERREPNCRTGVH